VIPQRRHDPFRPPADYGFRREEAPVVEAELHSDQRAWVVLRYDEVRQTLEHPGISEDAQHPHFPEVREGVTSRENDTMLRHMDAPMHGRCRRMMTRQFTAERVNELQPELLRIVADTIAAVLATGGPVDLYQEVSPRIPTTVIWHCRGWLLHQR
jgi:cytochrome P450